MTVGVAEAKQRLSELIERALRGEIVVITCRGEARVRLVGVAAKRKRNLRRIFDRLASVRLKLPEGTTVRDLIEEGRRF
jgi:prevent-host-death family protein